MTISDDILSALLDGELEPAESERLRALIANDEDLMRRVERLRLAGTLVQEAFAPIAAAPAPRDLRAAAGAQRDWSKVIAPVAAALAACAACFALGLSLRDGRVDRLFSLDHGLSGATFLSRALNETISSVEVRSGEVVVTPIYSFRDQSGRACRVFRIQLSADALEGAACREASVWAIAALAPVRGRAGGFIQADANDTMVIEAMVDALSSEEISPDEESALIARRWASE